MQIENNPTKELSVIKNDCANQLTMEPGKKEPCHIVNVWQQLVKCEIERLIKKLMGA